MRTQKYYESALREIGQQLASMRKKKGYGTIKSFVAHHDLPEIQYWRIEKGKANITLKSLIKILSIHNVTLRDFFSPKDDVA